MDRLFVSRLAREWGKFDRETGIVTMTGERGQGAEDLYDLAAVYTYLNRGCVFAVEPGDVPGGESVAAVYRF